jgi:hypothetical protein
MARFGDEIERKGSVLDLRRGKYGAVFQEVAEQAYFGKQTQWDEFKVSVLHLAVYAAFRDSEPRLTEELAQLLTKAVLGGDRVEQGRAAFTFVWLAFRQMTHPVELRKRVGESFRLLRDAVGRLLEHDDPPVEMAASWALVWAGESRLPRTPPDPDTVLKLYHLWRKAESPELIRLAAWAFSTQPLLPRHTFPAAAWGNCDALFGEAGGGGEYQGATAVLAWYRRTPWSDSVLAGKIREHSHAGSPTATFRQILATLGEPGTRILDEWDKVREPATASAR